MSTSSHTETKAPSCSQLKVEYEACAFEEIPAFIEAHATDERKQVQALLARAHKHYAKEKAQRTRVCEMYRAMHDLGGDGVVLGLDEVGRGPLAGPLTVAAVALDPQDPIWGINDSKQLSEQTREQLAAQIKLKARAIGIAHIEPQVIDELGMAKSLRMAMLQAIENSGVQPDSVLIDGVPLHIHPKETCIVKGDAKVACIAAASIVAKVTRDEMMRQAAKLYPGYGFEQNKGYGSAQHIEAIARLGLSPIHRRSFCTNFPRPDGASA